MTGSIFVSANKRQTLKKVFAGFMALSLNLSLGGVATLLTSNVAYATTVSGYSISGSSSTSGLTVTLSGTASGNPFTGKGSDQVIGVDWTGACAAATATAFPFTSISIVGGTGADHNGGSFTNATWTTSHVFSTAGTHSVCVKVYHGNFNGNDGSDAATFSASIVIPPALNLLTVSKAGNGFGTVTSIPAGISCGSTCSASYTSGTAVTLTATPATGSTFSGWSGACTGTGACSVTMSAAKSITATFADTLAPDTSITSGPSGTVNTTSATFTFTSTEAGTFRCSLDGAASVSCVSPRAYSSLSNGSHTFSVFATDVAGNTDASPDTRTWTVDTIPPTVSITSPLGGGTTGSNGTVLYSVGDAVTVTCTLDGTPVACTTGGTYAFTTLSTGSHTFAIAATDAVGNTGSTHVTWTVDATGPTVMIDTHPTNPSTSSTGTFTFSSNETPTTFTCTMDANSSTACVSGLSYLGLIDGTHNFRLSGMDQFGNIGSVTSFSWLIAMDKTLTIIPAGTGSGSVTSNPSGISCGAICARSFGDGTSVTLTATPATGSTFAGWSGACTGAGTCTVTMTAANTVTATFNLVDPVCTDGQQLVNLECVTPAPVCNPNVNLLQNGGFEAPVQTPGGWSIVPFTDPLVKWLGSWVVPHASGNLGLEIQAGVFGWTPAEGSQFAELDGDHPTAIWQNVPTMAGYDYVLNFKYSPRPGTSLGNNVLEVSKDGSVLGAQISRGSTAGDTEWSNESRIFQATGASTEVKFADVSATDDSLGTYLDAASLTCAGPHVPKATIVATKVVCDNESDLPNWSYGSSTNIDANTATEYVAAHLACHLEKNWNFEWAPTSAGDPGDAFVGSAGSPWATFGPTNSSGVAQTVVPFTGEGMTVWMREVLKDGYIPFTYHTDNSNVSAEMYCNGDVKNYDNLDYAQAGDGQTTYCVAFNAPKPITHECPTGQHWDEESCVPNNPPPTPSCQDQTSLITILSDETSLTASETPAALAWVHPEWTAGTDAALSGASWIWSTTEVADPRNGETVTFTKQFSVSGTPTAGSLVVAADNTYEVTLNGTSVGGSEDGDNFHSGNEDTFDVSALLHNGANTLVITAHNLPYNTDVAHDNPAGLMYKLTINKNACESASAKAHLVIKKVALGGDNTFNFTVTHGEDTPINVPVTTVGGAGTSETIDITPDTSYVVDEPIVPAGWSFKSLDCVYDDASIGVRVSPTKHEITVKSGDTVTCTYTNTKNTPSLKVIKHVINDNGGTKQASEFTLHVNIDMCSNITGVQASVPEGMFRSRGACYANDFETLNTIFDWFKTKTAYAIRADLFAPASFSGNEQGTMVYFDVASTYGVSEDADSGYTTTYSADCNGSISSGEHKTCIVTNDDIAPVTNGGGGGGGGSSTFDYFGCTNPAATNFNALANKDDNSCKLPGGNGKGATTTGTDGEVLGASTTTEPNLSLPAACAANPYLHDYLKFGKKNDSAQVKLLQQFLNDKLGANLPVNGYFGKLTRMWVKKLQKAHHQEIIQPWIDAGYKGKDIENGTGYVYKTTLRYINIMMCDAANIPMPDLTPDIN